MAGRCDRTIAAPVNVAAHTAIAGHKPPGAGRIFTKCSATYASTGMRTRKFTRGAIRDGQVPRFKREFAKCDIPSFGNRPEGPWLRGIPYRAVRAALLCLAG